MSSTFLKIHLSHIQIEWLITHFQQKLKTWKYMHHKMKSYWKYVPWFDLTYHALLWSTIDWYEVPNFEKTHMKDKNMGKTNFEKQQQKMICGKFEFFNFLMFSTFLNSKILKIWVGTKLFTLLILKISL